MSRAKTERNAELVRRFLAGETTTSLAQRFGISSSRVCRLVERAGHKRSPQERSARLSRTSTSTNRDPEVIARKSAKMRAHWASGRIVPSLRILADDPAKREDYLTLRDAYGAAYARQAMGIAA